MNKHLSVITEISKITMPFKNKPGKIEITFKYPSYLDNVKKMVEEDFLPKLMETFVALNNPFSLKSKIRIQGLELKWSEDDE